MPVNDFSESFWICRNASEPTSLIDGIAIATEVIGMIPGLIVIILLFQLDGKTRTSLLMLRTLTICSFLQLLINFINNVNPQGVFISDYYFNLIVCIFWKSRFIYWIFTIIAIHAQVYFSTNRTMQIVGNLQLSFASSRNIDLVYIAGLVAYSTIVTIPQVFTIVYEDDRCYCTEATGHLSNLELTYAQVYVYFLQILIINSIILLISCVLVIKWVKNTPRDKFFDTLNALSFADTSEEELKAFGEIKNWTTSSVCMVPMFISFVVSFSYDTIYQFISAVGFCNYLINGPIQKVGAWLLLIHPALIPYYLFFYIPALRFWVLKQWARLMRLFGRSGKSHYSVKI